MTTQAMRTDAATTTRANVIFTVNSCPEFYACWSSADDARVSIPAARETTDVTDAPMKAYYVHAVALVAYTQTSTAIPAAMPMSIGFVVTRRFNVPTRNAPSTGPL